MFGAKYKKRIDELEQYVAKLESELYMVRREVKLLKNPPEPPKVWKRGDRVKGSKTCGFNASMTGTVQYVEMANNHVWVLRDGASSDVFYMPHELDPL